MARDREQERRESDAALGRIVRRNEERRAAEKVAAAARWARIERQ